MTTFYHYTSVECFRSIVETGEFHLTNIRFMNDNMELHWLLGYASKMLEERATACDDGDRRATYESAANALMERKFQHVYCGCFSSFDNDLTLWRTYGDSGAGVALGVDLDEIVNFNRDKVAEGDRRYMYFDHVPVKYDEDAHNRLAEECIRRAEGFLRNEQIAYMWDAKLALDLVQHAAYCKSRAYEREAEERLVLTWRSESELLDQYQDPVTEYEFFTKGFPSREKLRFRARHGEVVPFAPIKAPSETIRRVIVGPCFGGDDAIEAVKLFLAVNGVEIREVMVQRSEATYRAIA